ncbi:MAG: hypothetical protein M5U34_17765 [Chloroflexi bacterium]|nr:hypothetical protein [Chloroflexota bacterium]
MVEAHGGHIWVESEGEDEARLPGSRFHLTLPIYPEGARMQKQRAGAGERPSWLIG